MSFIVMRDSAANKHEPRAGQRAPPIVSPIHVTVGLAANSSSKSTAFSAMSSLDIGPPLSDSLGRFPSAVNPPAASERALEPVKDDDAECEQHPEPEQCKFSQKTCDQIWEYRYNAAKDLRRTMKRDEKLLCHVVGCRSQQFGPDICFCKDHVCISELVNGDRCPNQRAPSDSRYARPQEAKGYSELCEAHQKALLDSLQSRLKRVESAPARLETFDDIDEYEVPEKRKVDAGWRRRASLPAIILADAQLGLTPRQTMTAREAFTREQHSTTQWFLARQAMRKWLEIRTWEQIEGERKLLETQAWEARHPGKKGPKVIIGGFVLPEMQAVMGAKVPYARVASAIEQYVQSEQCPEEDKRIQAIYASLGRPRAS